MNSTTWKSFSRRGVLLFFFTLITSAISFWFFDQKLSVHYADGSREDLWVFAREITNIGLGSHYFLASSILFIFLFLWGKMAKSHPEWRKPLLHWSGQFFLSLCTSGFVIFLLKFVVGRARPHTSAPEYIPWNFDFFNFHWDNHSFPSGHSQVLFTVATMLTFFFPRGVWVFFLVAAGLAFTRVITHSHYLSDCIWGAYLGWLVTTLTVLKYRAVLDSRVS